MIPRPFADEHGIPLKETYWAISAFERAERQLLLAVTRQYFIWYFQTGERLERAAYYFLFLVVERAE